MKLPPIDVDAAKAELRAKSKSLIEAETAAKWVSRAAAAQELYAETKDLAWLLQAAEYEHEAIEHAAEAGDEVLAGVRSVMAVVREGLRRRRAAP